MGIKATSSCFVSYLSCLTYYQNINLLLNKTITLDVLYQKKKINVGRSSLFGWLLDVKEHLMKLLGWLLKTIKVQANCWFN
jgi:hypothetical protein